MANDTRAEMTYDEADRLTVLANLKPDDSVLTKFTYTYDNTGNRVTALEADGTRVTWTYDDTYQLKTEDRS